MDEENIVNFGQEFESDLNALCVEHQTLKFHLARENADELPKPLLSFSRYMQTLKDAFYEVARLALIAVTASINSRM